MTFQGLREHSVICYSGATQVLPSHLNKSATG
jgi:hypothetical protein